MEKIVISGFTARMPKNMYRGKAPALGFLTESSVRDFGEYVEVKYTSAEVTPSMWYRHATGVLATLMWHEEAKNASMAMHKMVVA